MRIGRRLSLMTLLAGFATYYAARAAMRRRDEQRRTEMDEKLRWETDGGATAAGPQPPGASF